MHALLAATLLAAASPSGEVAVGAPAPDFTVTADDGKPWKLSDQKGKTVVLVFYPKAFTGG